MHNKLYKDKPIIVQKFGGTSLGSKEKISAAAKIIIESARSHNIVVVVSAIGNTTDALLDNAASFQLRNCKDYMGEYDTVLSAGEQISAGIMALTLMKLGCAAKSYLGWQVPIVTNGQNGNGKIVNIDTDNIYYSLANNEVPIVAGFQGVSDGRIVTLGRGGSDITAVSLAAKLGCKCEIYTDVMGVYDTDPRNNHRAAIINNIPYDQLLEMSSAGASVIHPRAAALAKQHKVNLKILSPDNQKHYTQAIYKKAMEIESITAIVSDENIQYIDIKPSNNDKATICILERLKTENVEIHSIQECSNNSLSMIVADEHSAHLKTVLEQECATYIQNTSAIETLAMISVIGYGLKNDIALSSRIISLLSDASIKISFLNTAERKVSFFVEKAKCKEACAILHNELIQKH